MKELLAKPVSRISLLLLMVSISLTCTCQNFGSVRVNTLDQTGVSFPNVLVVVKSLDTGEEKMRCLTAEDGSCAIAQLRSGLYRVIATCPYGTCGTVVREVIVPSAPPQESVVRIKLPMKPLLGPGITVAPIIRIRIVSNGKPVSGAEVIVRNTEATWDDERRITDTKGDVAVKLFPDPVVFVVRAGDRLTEKVLTYDKKKPPARLTIDISPQ